jgi:hypothetical protein
MALDDSAEARRDCAAELGRLEWHGAAVESQDPGGEVGEVGVRRDEDAVLDLAVRLPIGALDPPGRVAGQLDACLACDLAHLPRRRRSVRGGLEVLREPEVALAAGRELDVLADAQHLERADRIASVIAPDDVPAALVRQERVGVERPLALHAAGDRPVFELDRPLL